MYASMGVAAAKIFAFPYRLFSTDVTRCSWEKLGAGQVTEKSLLCGSGLGGGE